VTAPTEIACLTPSGTGAIAVLALRGNRAWSLCQQLFRPLRGRTLPGEPPIGKSILGNLGEGAGDEVILAVPPTEGAPIIELHCHGGKQVVSWIIEQFTALGAKEVSGFEMVADVYPGIADSRAMPILAQVKTTKLAAIVLDQVHGAFRHEVDELLQLLQKQEYSMFQNRLTRLHEMAPLGRHLIEPWKIAICGAPNAGKSALLNALVGYQRSIVAPIAGTTRDVVTVEVAFEGWLFELADTAGIRDSADAIEIEGIARAKQQLAQADLILWLLDSTNHPRGPTSRDLGEIRSFRDHLQFVMTKIDQSATWDLREIPQAIGVSATKNRNMDRLVQCILDRLIPVQPKSGRAVPFTPELSESVELTHVAATRKDWSWCQTCLERCLN
jgi:tRNA modification GTPase